jgi:hypothetical protein
VKPDERALLDALRVDRAGPFLPGTFADAIGNHLGIHHKRVYYLLCKWADRDWWEYGVSARSGWFTDKGWSESGS